MKELEGDEGGRGGGRRWEGRVRGEKREWSGKEMARRRGRWEEIENAINEGWDWEGDGGGGRMDGGE